MSINATKIDQLRRGVREFDQLEQDDRNNELTIVERQRQIDQIIESGEIDQEKVQKKLSDARLTLDLCMAYRRRAVLRKQTLRKEIADLHQEVFTTYNDTVRQLIATREQDLRKALEPFYDGHDISQKVLRTVRESSQHFRTLDRCISHKGFSEDPDPDFIVQEARNLIAKIGRTQKLLGWA